VGRGGGSIEDLWAFNEECVARAIFACHTPVISAVGHEVDVTIADFVADLRAPTPSAAAELAVFDYRAFEERLWGYKGALLSVMEQKLQRSRMQLEQRELKLKLLSPENRIFHRRQRLIALADKLEQRMDSLMSDRKHRLSLYAQKLNGLSPLVSLERGYSYVQNQDGQVVRSVRQLKEGEEIRLRLLEGSAKAVVTSLLPEHGMPSVK